MNNTPEVTLFQRIISREIPAEIIYEDDTYIAILDIAPKTRGHALVIIKEPYRWVNEVPKMGEYFEVSRKISLAIQQALGAVYISYQTFGSEVPHAHIHIVPYYQLFDETWERHTSTPAELAEVGDLIREKLQ